MAESVAQQQNLSPPRQVEHQARAIHLQLGLSAAILSSSSRAGMRATASEATATATALQLISRRVILLRHVAATNHGFQSQNADQCVLNHSFHIYTPNKT
jgi:hypothetical protein